MQHVAMAHKLLPANSYHLIVPSPPLPEHCFWHSRNHGFGTLYRLATFAHQRKFKYKKQARWAMLITGVVVLGFLVQLAFDHFQD